MNFAAVIAMNFKCYKFFLYFSGLSGVLDPWIPIYVKKTTFFHKLKIVMCFWIHKIFRSFIFKKDSVGSLGVARIFDWGGANHKSHAMTSSETSKEEFFCEGRDIVEWKIRSRGLVLARNYWNSFKERAQTNS